MLAPLLVTSLVTCVLIMLAGWVRDRVEGESDVGATCPLFPVLSGRSRDAWGIEPPDRGGLADQPRNWTP